MSSSGLSEAVRAICRSGRRVIGVSGSIVEMDGF
jgi:hypothetical protein